MKGADILLGLQWGDEGKGRGVKTIGTDKVNDRKFLTGPVRGSQKTVPY